MAYKKSKSSEKVVKRTKATPKTQTRIVGSTQKRSVYNASEVSSITADWVARLQSPDTEVKFDIALLRARARAACKNISYAHRFVELAVTYIIGSTGIALQGLVTDDIKNEDDPTPLDFSTNKELERVWHAWGDVAGADGSSFKQLEQQIIRSWAMDGEIFIQLVYDTDNDFGGFALHLIDADLLPHQHDSWLTQQNKSGTGNRVVAGVELDKYNKPVAYNFYTKNPSDSGFAGALPQRIVRVPAEQVIHIKLNDRVHQTRGVPPLAAVLLALHQLSEMQLAQIVSVRSAAAKQAFITSAPDDASGANTSQYDPNGWLPVDVMETSPGGLTELPPGKNIIAYDPKNPGVDGAAFNRQILQSIATGLSVSYASLSQDLSNETFSSGRNGLVDMREHWKTLQQWIIRIFHQRVYLEFLKMAVLSGQLDISQLEIGDYKNIAWRPKVFDWIDPKSEADSNSTLVGLGVKSRTEVCSERGTSFHQVALQLAEEKNIADALGIDISAAHVTEKVTTTNPNDIPDGQTTTTETETPEEDSTEPTTPPKKASGKKRKQ